MGRKKPKSSGGFSVCKMTVSVTECSRNLTNDFPYEQTRHAVFHISVRSERKICVISERCRSSCSKLCAIICRPLLLLQFHGLPIGARLCVVALIPRRTAVFAADAVPCADLIEPRSQFYIVHQKIAAVAADFLRRPYRRRRFGSPRCRRGVGQYRPQGFLGSVRWFVLS